MRIRRRGKEGKIKDDGEEQTSSSVLSAFRVSRRPESVDGAVDSLPFCICYSRRLGRQSSSNTQVLLARQSA